MTTKYSFTIDTTHPQKAGDSLAAFTGLSKTRIKRAMVRGAVWLRRQGRNMHRLRRATAPLRRGDVVELYYDPDILEFEPPSAICMKDCLHYSIWFKPAGLLTQGTRFGDHCALLRHVELHFGGRRKVFPVHRIDRETSGLVIVAHGRDAAGRLSALMRNRFVEKSYLAWVRGDLRRQGAAGKIDQALDGKPARTDYAFLRYDQMAQQTLARAVIHTGRYHQIRRHFAAIGHPVMGDPRYGKGNKNKKGLRLVADRLCFECPFGNGRVQVAVQPEGFDI